MNNQNEANTSSPGVDGKYPTSSNVLVITVLGLIAFIIAGAYFWYTNKESIDVPTNEDVLSESVWDPAGSIFLTLRPKDGSGMGIYEFNIKENQLKPYYFSETMPVFTGRFGDNESESKLFVSQGLPDGWYQIMEVMNGAVKQLTESKIGMKRHPFWSNTHNALIYGGKEEITPSLGAPGEFSVFLKEEGKTEVKITTGAIPTLTPDGNSLVVLRDDGLYKVSILGTSSEKIWGMTQGTTSLNMHFSISDLGKYIAWTSPDYKKISVMQVATWEPFKGNVRYVIDTHAFWPVFSPDEKYLAFERVNWTDPKNPIDPELVVMDLTSLEQKVVKKLDDYDQFYMFMNDWK